LRKRIVVSVISDLVTDQRVQKECNSLHQNGYDVLLLGRKSANTFGLEKLPYKWKRFADPFKRGPLMYLYFNLRLLIFLLFTKRDIYWANDLDSLLPNYLISKLKGKKLVYDSHEYFTLTVYKRQSRKIWQTLESFLFPKQKNVITVNNSIKRIYEEKYKVPVHVLRNMPYRGIEIETVELNPAHANKKILVVQGRGINEHRGAEEVVTMMQDLPEDFILYFLGGGTIIDKLKKMSADLGLSDRVFFLGIMPYAKLMGYTRNCYMGLITEDIHFNDAHRFTLPNRFFDYIKANIPVLSTEVPDIKEIIDKYDIGDYLENVIPKDMANKVIQIAARPEVYQRWKQNTRAAANDLCWENEEHNLIEFMNNLK
jgi:glycosyltransferase involved in cell wall biosynthesis